MASGKKILVTGSDGQLGRCLQELASSQASKFVFTDVAQLDITDREAVRAMIAAERPDWVVNCAAYTAVDKAEAEPELAHRLNADAVRILAEESAAARASLVHISTDYVFAGNDPEPRVETDPVDPQSVYGITKLEGEQNAQLNPRHIILRTSWLYSAYGNNFVKTMRRLGAEKAEISVVADQWGSPTSAHDLAQAVLLVTDKPQYGTYHFSDEGTTNWALFAEAIMELSGLECRVKPITTAEFGAKAPRPAYSMLSKRKFSETFGMVIPEWEMSLETVIGKLDREEQA